MSNILYDFLTESFLFKDELIENKYHNISEAELKKELALYRQYVLKNIEVLFHDINDGFNNTTVFSEMYSTKLININLLKQCSLYVHKFVVDDPLFRLTERVDKGIPIGDHLNEYLGFQNNQGMNRIELVDSIKYLKSLTPGIVTGYIKMIPGSFMHEPPKEIPLTYSTNYFSDVRQKEILDFFREHAIVSPLKKIDGGFRILSKQQLKPCRAINIEFKDHLELIGKVFFLMESKVISKDDETRTVRLIQTLPEEAPSKDYFDAWVFQSINQTANHFCIQIENELSLSARLKAMYLTQSSFVDKLLRLNFEESSSVRDKIQVNSLQHLLKLQLPVIENATFGEVLSARYEDGEVFYNFRNELERKFNDLRSIQTEEELTVKLENISHELTELHVDNIERQTTKLRNKFFRNSAIILASLAGAVATNGFSILGAAIAAGQGYNSFREYKDAVKQNPAYLLWKISKNAKR